MSTAATVDRTHAEVQVVSNIVLHTASVADSISSKLNEVSNTASAMSMEVRESWGARERGALS